MLKNNVQDILVALRREAAKYQTSPSHGDWHTNLLLHFAQRLQQIHGGDIEIISAAAILHDLGRADPSLHGKASIARSVELSQNLLKQVDFPKEKINEVVRAIQQHDQPGLTPDILEAKILKDADFLAGFGAWGVIRIAMWAGETGGGVEQIQDRLENRLLERLQSLEFRESRRLALNELQFSDLFTAYWNKTISGLGKEKPGKYIVLEGISGSGKDTQAELLMKYLEERGYSVTPVSEPSDIYREIRELWKETQKQEFGDSFLRRFILLADRYELVKNVIIPAIDKGNIVVSNRSFISFLVYQCFNKVSGAYDNLDFSEMAYIHRFVPVPDLIILYDLDAKEAMRRIEAREKKKSWFETPELLPIHREKYLSIIRSGKFGMQTALINSNVPIENVKAETRKIVDQMLAEDLDY